MAPRRRSRRNSQFGEGQRGQLEELLREEQSPEQVSGYLGRMEELSISHKIICRHVWRNLATGGIFHVHLRGARKQCRKRCGRYESRERLAGKRVIGKRPALVERALPGGHWKINTVMGESLGESSECILTPVERKTSYVLIGKLQARALPPKPTERSWN